MATNINFNGSTYSIPAVGDSNWGDSVSNYLIAIASGALQKTGGAFTLTGEVNFGATYGLKAAYVKSQATNPSGTGIFRLGNNESISWRNQANNADLAFKVNASNALEFNSSALLLAGLGSIVNADINAAAAIAYSKLNLVGSIVDADVSAVAAIAYSKLNLSGSIVNADIGGAAAIAYSKLNLNASIVDADISGAAAIAYSKLNLTGAIVDSDISASAAIAISKLAALTASKLLVSDGSGVISASSVTAAEAGYLSGVTSAIQTQLNAKAGLADNNEFTGTVNFGVMADTSTGSGQTLATPTKMIVRSTGALTSIAGFTAPLKAQLFIWENVTGGDVTVVNDATATAADRIYTGTGNDLIVKDKACLFFVYDVTSSRWRIVGGAGGASQRVVSTISATGTVPDSADLVLVDASGGAVTLTLQAASTQRIGKQTTFKRIDSTSNLVTIQRAGADTIDGATSATIDFQYDAINIIGLTASSYGVF